MKSIQFNFDITGTKIELPFETVCSVTDREFGGLVIIEYRPRNLALEYVDAEQRLRQLCQTDTTAEELAHQVFQETWSSLNPQTLKVIVDVKHSKAHQPVQVWIEK